MQVIETESELGVGTAEENKVICLFVPRKGLNFKVIHNHIKPIGGFYNGVGWFVEKKYEDAVMQICQNADLPCFAYPIPARDFETFKKQNKLGYLNELIFKKRGRIYALRNVLSIPQGIPITKEDEENLKLTNEGTELLELASECEALQERIKQAEADEKLAKLQLDTSGAFQHLLKPISEEQISEEMKNISSGIDVGFKIGDIDLTIPGGAVSIIAAPTSHGKTALLINFSLGAINHAGQENRSVYFFSYEESRAAIVSLFLNTYIGEEISKNNRRSIKTFFRSGDQKYISETAKSRFLDKKNQFFNTIMKPRRLNVLYSEMSAEELVAAIRFLKKHTDVGLICIDYMQLIKLGREIFKGSRQEELKQICLLLKDCAVETGLPILLAAQFSRQVTCEAELSPIYISEAGDIERVANMVLGFWNRNFEGFTSDGNKAKGGKLVPKESAIYMEILKGRETGANHSTVLDFDGNTGKLMNRQEENW